MSMTPRKWCYFQKPLINLRLTFSIVYVISPLGYLVNIFSSTHPNFVICWPKNGSSDSFSITSWQFHISSCSCKEYAIILDWYFFMSKILLTLFSGCIFSPCTSHYLHCCLPVSLDYRRSLSLFYLQQNQSPRLHPHSPVFQSQPKSQYYPF